MTDPMETCYEREARQTSKASSTERERFVAFLANLEGRLEKTLRLVPATRAMSPVRARLRSELCYLSGMVKGGRELLESMEEDR